MASWRMSPGFKLPWVFYLNIEVFGKDLFTNYLACPLQMCISILLFFLASLNRRTTASISSSWATSSSKLHKCPTWETAVGGFSSPTGTLSFSNFGHAGRWPQQVCEVWMTKQVQRNSCSNLLDYAYLCSMHCAIHISLSICIHLE